MKFKLKNIRPNPHRHIEHYPIQKEKVAALRESIKTTEFWDNIVARRCNGDHGEPHAEIGYGHHRLVALRELFPPNHEVELIVRDLSDEKMIQIMAHENLEEWGTEFIVTLETIKAVVEAYGAGKIALQKLLPKTPSYHLRSAPSFKRDVVPGRNKIYTAQTVARFLGWTEAGSTEAQEKVHIALNALELIEKGALKERDFYHLLQTEAEALVKKTNESLAWREKSVNPTTRATAVEKASKVAKEVAQSFREDKKSGPAAQRAERAANRVERRPKEKPDVREFLRALSKELDDLLTQRDKPRITMLLDVLHVIDDVDKRSRENLYETLVSLSHRAKSLADMVKSGKTVKQSTVLQLLERS